MTTQAAQARNLEHSVPLAALAIAFLKVALYGIGGGGGLVWARRIAVDQRRWISEQDFAGTRGEAPARRVFRGDPTASCKNSAMRAN